MTGPLPPLQRSGRADLEWQLNAATQYGQKRELDTIALLGQEALADVFDPGWPDEQKIRFVAEIDAGILPPERKQARLMTLPPELAGPIAEADAARGAARAAYDLGKTFGSERGRDSVSVFGRGGMAVKPVLGAMRGMGLGAVEGFFKEGSDESEGLRRTLDTDDVAMWREAQAFAKEGKSPLGPAVKTKGLLPEDREVELYFEGAKAGYAEATGKAPSATTIGEITEGVGGLAGFVFGGPGKFIGAGGAAFKLLAGKAASKGVQLLLGMAGRAAGYAGYQAVLPLPQEDLAYVEEARAAGGDEAAASLETDLRALRAIQGAAMWPVLEVVGGATGALGKALGATKEGARGVAGKVAGGAATGAGFTAGEAVLDLPVMQAVSEAMVGRDPGVRSAFGKAILHTLDGHPDALAAWIEAGKQMGTGAAVFGAFHGLGAFSRGANLPLELQERVLGMQTRLGAEAREELRSKGVDPEVADRLVQVDGERPERVTVSTGKQAEKPGTGPVPEEPRPAAGKEARPKSGTGPDPEVIREETPKERERRAAQTEETAPTRERLRELREELDAREERTPEVERAREEAGKAEELLAAGRVGEAERALEDAEVRLYTGKRPSPAEPDPVPHEAEVRRADMEAAIEVAPREPGGKPERITITPSTVSEGMLEVELPRGPQGSRRRMLVNSVEEALEMVRERNPEADVSLRGPLAQEVQVAEQRRTEAQAETRTRRKASLEAAEPAREQAKVARRAANEERLKAELTAGLKDAVRDLKAQAAKAKGSERARLVAEALAKAREKVEPRTPEEGKALAKEESKRLDASLEGRTTEAERQLADAMKREDSAAVSKILAEFRDVFGGRPSKSGGPRPHAQGEMFGGLPLLGWLKNLPDLLFAKVSAVETEAVATLHTKRKWSRRFNATQRLLFKLVKDDEAKYGELISGPKREAILNTLRDVRQVYEPLLDKSTGPLAVIGESGARTKLDTLFFLWAHSAGKTKEHRAEDAANFKAELAKKRPDIDADALLGTWRRSASKLLRLLHRMHPAEIGHGGFRERERTAIMSIRSAEKSLATAQKMPPALRKSHTERLTKSIGEYTDTLAEVRKERKEFRDRYGYDGNYVHLAYEIARESEFVKRSEKTWFKKGEAKKVALWAMKHRSTPQGKEGYVESIVFSITKYVEPLLWKLHSERARAKLDPDVEGVLRPVGNAYESKITGETVDPLWDVLKVGREINLGTNGVRIIKLDRAAGEVTVRPASFTNARADIVLPEALARRELMRKHGGLKSLVPSGEGRFISEQYDADLTDFMRRNERYVAKASDKVIGGLVRGLQSHGIRALLSGIRAPMNNMLASVVTRVAMFGPKATAQGQVRLMRALGAKARGKGSEDLMVLRDAAVFSTSEIDMMLGLTREAKHGRTVIDRIGSIVSAPMRAISWPFGVSEKYNKASTALAAYARARAEGMTYPQSIAYARKAVAMVDFWFVPSMSPGLLKDSVVRPLMALVGAPLRLMNKLHYQLGAARARDQAAGTDFMDYLTGKTDHYNVPLRYAVASGIATFAAYKLLGTSVGRLFGTQITDLGANAIPGMDEFFQAAEEKGIPREAFFIPGFFGDVLGGGFAVDFLDASKTAITSEEHDRWERFWDRVAPMVIGRLPWDLRAAYHAQGEVDPWDPNKRLVRHPDSVGERLNPIAEPTGKVKETATPAQIWLDLVLPGTGIRHVARWDLRNKSAREAKQIREEAEEVNRMAAKLRRPDLSPETRAETATRYRALLVEQRRRAPRLSRERIIETTQFTDLERSVLKGSAEAQARNLIRYLATPEADPAKLPTLARLVFGEDANISRETRRAYIEARRKFLERTGK